MNLSSTQFTEVLAILEKIDQGLVHPRVPGRMGRFMRQYETGRAQLDRVLGVSSLVRRADGALSGRALGAIDVFPILRPEVSVLGFPVGEVADTLAICEQLGGPANLVLWLKGPVANATLNLVREHPGVRLSGDYRWTPLSRVTPGEARLEPSPERVLWQYARCLKVVADDLDRPPHALEFVLDYRLGPPGIKFFRSAAILKTARDWLVLPSLAEPRHLDVGAVLPEAASALDAAALAIVLMYREPWNDTWTIVDGAAASERECFEHAVVWADFRRELEGLRVDGEMLRGIRAVLAACGVRPAGSVVPSLTQVLLPAARDVVGSLRGIIAAP